ncbi:hypothetical protein [Desulfoluna sp.]|uniref:hypothetical protein n=1 Tax=Desulfoluna sp. TaxID=2045199 RepID=UPI00262B58ED|nr:hypothetical protein [Desulfoluna sp.]
MSGLKFLITLFVIYLIFRSIMRKVLSAVNSEGGGALKNKMGNVIQQMKQEMEKARLEAEREASGTDAEILMDDDPWEELRGADVPRSEVLCETDSDLPDAPRNRWEAEEERPSLHERWEVTDESPSSQERWDAVDETPSLWDLPGESEAAPCVTRKRVGPSEVPEDRCRGQRKRRRRLKEAVIWKEILDSPIGMRS